MTFRPHIMVLVAPLLLVVLQASGCTRQGGLPPPGGTYYSNSAGALFEQFVKLERDPEENIASFPLQKAHRPLHSPQRILIGAGERGVVSSANGGQTWEVITTPLAFIHDVVLLRSGILVVSGINGEGQGFVLRTIDDAKSWEVVLTVPLPQDTRGFQIIRVPEGPSSRVISIAVDPFNPDRIYAGSSLGSIFVGEQSAKVWRTEHQLDTRNLIATSSGLSVTEIIVSPHRQGELLLLTSAQSLIRIQGDKQEEITIPRDVKNPEPFSFTSRKLVFDATYIPGFPNALMVGVDDGAVISRDGGQNWEQLALPVDQIKRFNTGAVAVSPTNSNRLLVAINSIVYRSEDGGRTWNSFTLNLPSHGITSLLIDPQNASRVLAVTTPLET